MAHFSIWIPNGTGSEADALRSVGLGDLISSGNDLTPSASLSIAGEPGPGNTPGLLLQWLDAAAPPARQARLGYHPDQQDWQPLPAFKLDGELKPKGTAWLGIEKDRPVTPQDLLRRGDRAGEVRYRGNPVKLGDGNDWLLPDQFLLPMEFAIDPDTGEDTKVVTGAAQPVWEKMQQAFAAAKTSFLKEQQAMWDELPESERSGLDAPEKFSADVVEWTENQVQDYCVWALSLNYRVTKLIAVRLHLFNDQNLWPSFYSIINWQVMWPLQKALKKTEDRWESWRAKASESPATSGGAAA